MKNKSTWFFAILFSLIGIVYSFKLNAQFGGPTTPNGIFDTIFDKDGVKYLLNDLKVNYIPVSGGSTGKVSAAITSSCSAGYFNLYYESGSLGTGTPAQQAANQAVLCQVFTDISNFIISPLNNLGNTTRVNIWVRDPVNVYAPNPIPTGLLGSATQYYSMPANPAISGIVDGETYKTIISGIDSYSNVASPIFVSSSGSTPSGAYFHGMVDFDFNSVNWCTNMSITPTVSQFDLYTVALHEVVHALGFASLIDNNGFSKFGAAYNYFSRYDRFLSSGATPLLTQTISTCANYQYQFNPSLSTNILTPSVGSCSNSITYNGTANQQCYTPSVWNAGSSISHFDNACHTGSFVGGNTGFVMHPFSNPGSTIRFMQPEERNVLCDLGYNVNTIYGSASATLSSYNYGGSACSGISIIGINDGFTSGNYTWFNTTTLTIPISQVLANDHNSLFATNPTSLTCAEVVLGNGTLTNTGTNLVFTPTGGFTGVVLLRYIPFNGINSGNITYIYGFITPAACTPINPCDIVQNGGFESIQSTRQCGDGWGSGTNGLALNCWFSASHSCDLFGTGCTNASTSSAPLATVNINSYNLGTNTCYSSPTFSAPYTSTSPQNNHVIGFAHLFDGTAGNYLIRESMFNYLSSPLIPGQVYKLSFWTYNYSGMFYTPWGDASSFPAFYAPYFMNLNQQPSVFSIASSSLTTFGSNSGTYSVSAAGSITDTPIFSYTNTTVNTWQYVSTTFTYSGTSNGNLLVLGGDIFANFTNGYYPSAQQYFHYDLIDDVSILPINTAPTFSLPLTTYCNNNGTVVNIGQYATPPGGTFSGPGVLNAGGGQFNFDPQAAGAGIHSMIYTYVSAGSCTNTAVQQVTVIATNGPTITATANPTIICSGLSSTLTATGANTYTWNTSATTATTSVSPSLTNTYTVTGTNTVTGCSNTQTVLVTVKATPTVAVSNVSVCIGSPTVISASGATSYLWNTGATTNSISVTPTVITIYTVTGTTNGCTNTKTVSVTPLALPVLSITPTSATICFGKSTVLTAGGANTYTWNPGNSTTNPFTVSPSSTTIYTVTGKNTTTGCTNTKTVTVTVNALPIVTAVASPTAICVSQSVTLTAGGATTYTWLPSSQTTTVITATPTVNTTYTVTGTNSVGCNGTKTVNVIVYSNTPTVTVNSSLFSICGSNSATMIASGANNYTWTPTTGPITSATAVVTPTAPTIYTVIGNNGIGCGASTKTVIVIPASTLCCSASTGSIGTSPTSSVSPAAGSFTNTSAIINVQGIVTYTGNTSYTGYTFRMAPGALIRVNPNQTLTLTNCKLFSCSELWDGILLREDDLNFGNLVLNNTTIEDMYNGIVVDYDNYSINSSAPSGSITINASKLNKNYISVQIRNSSGMSNGISDYPFSITSSTISSTTSTTSPGSGLKPSSTYTYAYNQITNGSTGASAPYVYFPRTFTGIQLTNLGYLCPVVIGSRTSSTLTNTFNNLDFGVNGTEVYTKVYNNYFKNITGSVKSLDPSPLGPPPAQGPDEIGIAVCITQTTTANYNTCIVGANPTLPTITNPYPDGNLFEDCNRGVKTNNNRYVTVLGNVFTTTTTSIPVSTSSGYPPMFVINPNTYYYYTGQNAVWSSALGTKADLSYNLISNHNTGIYDSHSINPTISGTVIVQGNDISAPASTGYCKQAIQIDQAGGTNIPTDQAYIYNNRLINVYRGVVSNGVFSGLLIKGNTINVEGVAKTLNYTAASQRTGVALTSCQYASIKGNSFTQTGSMPTTTVTALAINGVYLKNSPYGKTECNTATNLGRCFVFEGTCDNSWKVNAMSNSYIGLEIRVLGRIGTQGAPAGSPNLSANTWTTITRETNIISSAGSNTLSPLYLLANAGGATLKTQPTLNFGTPTTHSYVTGPTFGIRVSPGTSYTCSSGSAQRTSSGNNTANNSNMKTSEAQDSLTDYISLANSDENTYDVFTDEFLYQNKQLVYKLLDSDSLNVADGSTLDNFYDANHKTALAQLTQVQQAIANDDVSAANLANASVSPSNQVEYKHQRANELTLKYLGDRFYVYTDAEKQDLYSYANECVIKGYYVVQARNMINIITNQILNYNDDCEAEANTQRKAKVQAIGVSSYSSFNLFPNPNSGNMQLDYNLGGFTKAEFKLYDITGKLISSKTIAENEGTLIINEQNLHNGVYFYHILVGEKTIKTDKIVIIK